MLLAVDVGNSHTTIGVFEGEVLRCELRLATRRGWTRDELAVGLHQALGLVGIELRAIDQAIIACVVPSVLGPLCEALGHYAGVEPLVVGPGIRTGMPIRYDSPQDVGADRIVTAVAAYERHRLLPEGHAHRLLPEGHARHRLLPEGHAHRLPHLLPEGHGVLPEGHGVLPGVLPEAHVSEAHVSGAGDRLLPEGHAGGGEGGLIVVDFGTATTFDVVSPKPEYLGGVIAPGIGIAADALFERAAKLPRVDISRPDRVVGRNTVGAIQSGLVYGYIGLVEGLIARIKAEVGWPCRVIATGGFAPVVANESGVIDVVDDALVLEGLRIIHGRNLRDPSHGRNLRDPSSRREPSRR
jgi:type III pantothenate kinase